MDPKPDKLDEPPVDGREQLRLEADANAARSAALGRHIRTFSEKAAVKDGDAHWTPALPLDLRPH
jgi:hypothetical protein